MTQYGFPTPRHGAGAEWLRTAKARRQASLRRVHGQRAQVYKRTVADWQKEGLIIRGSELKERYQKR
jgi:hypothetical protein